MAMPALFARMSTAPMLRDDGGDERVHLCRFRHVAMDVGGADCLGRGLARLVQHVGDHDGRAFRGEALGDGEPDAAGCSGDDGDAVFQSQGTCSCCREIGSEHAARVGIDDDRGERHVARP